MDADLLARRLHYLGRRLAQAQRQFRLIADGDRIVLGLSGGKDSTALLLALPAWRRTVPLSFDLVAVHVETEDPRSNQLCLDHLTKITAIAGVPLATVTAGTDSGPPPRGRVTHPCFRCAWHRREALFRWAVAHGYGKLALGHHLDDAAETALMNLLYKGRLEALAPSRSFFAGAVTLIRPLILAEAKELARVAACLDDPPLTCTCATAAGAPPDSARAQMRRFLRSFGKDAATAKRHLWRASLPAQ
jgi:tRNA 2-thiocytidine biosynthesis protein TtcA